jgi:hypothetical protein
VLLCCDVPPPWVPGIWQGTVVALKVLLLPPQLTRNERRRQMALMEAVISSAMSHSNTVQVRTWPIVLAGEAVGSRGAGYYSATAMLLYTALCLEDAAAAPAGGWQAAAAC